jgi:hypothetical protein
MHLDESKFRVFATFSSRIENKLTNNQLNEEEYKVYEEQDEDPAALGESHCLVVGETDRGRKGEMHSYVYIKPRSRIVLQRIRESSRSGCY